MSDPGEDPGQIDEARPSDKSAVVDMLVAAFDSDPLTNYLTQKARDRRVAMQAFFGFAFDKSSVRRVRRDGRAAALWTAPGQHPGFWSQLSLLPNMVRHLGWRNLPKTLRTLAQIDRLHPKQQEHYYLWVLGVHPTLQGQGIGTALVEQTLVECDHQGYAAYLETANEQNVRLYRKLGFETQGETQLDGDGPHIWSMWRCALS